VIKRYIEIDKKGNNTKKKENRKKLKIPIPQVKKTRYKNQYNISINQ